jgi:hypothetical protein
MGSVFKKPKVPDAPAPPPPPPAVPDEMKQPEVQKELSTARSNIVKRAAVAQGRQDDILTSPLGLPSSLNESRKSLLGR